MEFAEDDCDFGNFFDSGEAATEDTNLYPEKGFEKQRDEIIF